ncbi:MAG TPA: efflux RND transporter permease subunit, partial [Elusimicrobiales bacterium]|nr:efflux RND transporter permease subunit [Elusimicrobiales bacterium]
DLYPDVEFPFVTIQTALPGASPEEIETSITKPIEEAVNTIEGIEDLNSTSYEGLSVVFIKFTLEKNIDVAAQDVRDKVNAIQRQFPLGTDPPIVGKFDVGAIPVLNIVIYGNRSLIDITQIAKKKIKENIESVGGVGSVDIIGGREREIHIEVNPLKMSSYGISIKEVKDAITEQNIEIPGGKVEQKNMEFGLRTLGRIKDVADFKDIVIKTLNGTPIKISDVAEVQDTGEYIRSMSFLNGKQCIRVVVNKQSGANTVKVVKRIKERFKEIEYLIPSDIKTKILGDQSKYIQSSVHSVQEHLVMGAICAALVVMLFMGDLRSTIISAVAIPTSIISTFLFMRLAGFTLNTMTLLGLTISVGIVIDDAIVMLENIYRHIEKLKKEPLTAAIEGAKEIGFAIIAMSASLLVIFLPLAYMSGIVGRFVKSYGLTIAFAVAVSTLVALTLTPMLCSLFLKLKTGKKHRLHEFTNKINEFLIKYYTTFLKWSLSHRKTMVILSILIMLSTVPMLRFVGKDFFPQEDTGIFSINVKAPEGSSLSLMKDIFTQIETEVRVLPHIKDVLASIGVTGEGISSSNEGSLTIEMVKSTERKITLAQIMSKVRQMLSKYKELRTSVSVSGGFAVGEGHEINYIIAGPDLDKLEEYAGKVAQDLKKQEGVVDVDLSFSFAKPEYRVEINRTKAHDLRVKIKDIASSLRTMVGGEEDITKFKEGDELYQVRLRAKSEFRTNIQTIRAMVMPANNGDVVRLDNVADVKEGLGPTKIDRFGRQRQVTVLANLEGIPLSVALKKADESFDKLNAPPEYQKTLAGRAREMQRMLRSFLVAFLFAFLFIYMILASQFESFVYPISIMVCLPLTVPFAVLSLFITGEYLTIFSILGMFMLVGIVKKNAILQVDYTNTLRGRGLARYDAIIQANQTRLRPILMTTITLIAGMLPTAFGTGEGSAVRRTMAWVVIGGQTLSLMITLLMTPVTYSLLDDLQIWFKKKFGKGNLQNPKVSPENISQNIENNPTTPD